MICPNCGKEIPDGSKFCPYCGARTDEKDDLGKTYGDEVSKAKAMQSVQVGLKNPGLAAVLSFLYTGLGQIYNGQIGKGILFIILGAIFIALMFVVVGFILYPILWIINIVDAYQTANKINKKMLGG